MTRVLVTGCGGPAAISFIESVSHWTEVEVFSADVDPYAAGLYLVGQSRRLIVPRGDDPGFAERMLELCRQHAIDVLVPTVDSELLPLSEQRERFEGNSTRLIMAKAETLQMSLDKHRLLTACAEVVPVPRSKLIQPNEPVPPVPFPQFVKPRFGSGSRGATIVASEAELGAALGYTEDMLVQQLLPGREFSVDVLCDPGGKVVAAVPRERLKVDSGVAITSRVLKCTRLQSYASAVARCIGLTGVANIQFKEDFAGIPRLLEVNPRFPGTMSLTVAAGVNMPLLALQHTLGYDTAPLGDFKEVAMTRVFRSVEVGTLELAQLEREAYQRDADTWPIAKGA